MGEFLLSNDYVAGLFDGEGWFEIRRTTVQRSSKPYSFQLYIRLALKQEHIVEFLQERFGGSISISRGRKETHNDSYVWTIQSATALEFCKQIVPQLFIKKEQGLLAWQFQEHVSGSNFGMWNSMSEDVYQYRLACFEQMKFLNLRGVAP